MITENNEVKNQPRQQMNIVVVGHVDHGKSTVIGRLLADTGSLPQGKLEMVKEQCRQNARPFEYAFLLDALKDEQAQGITIDSARCFFKTKQREYIIIDAPGHIEFLKNMISGAARAEAGLLVIDAKEGVQENSRRHGYMISMLGIRQLAVCVNKMDLVDYDRGVYEDICQEFTKFLGNVGIQPKAFIPLSAREGDNIVGRSEKTPWYDGCSVLEMLDLFEKEPPPIDKPLRLPVQDIYKFTADGDDRRIIAGRIETGSVSVGDEVVFLPSGKQSRVASIEEFNGPGRQTAYAGESTGITLESQIYIRPGELMCAAGQNIAKSSTRLQANMFWLSPQPMIMDKRYKMKLANSRVPVWLTDIATVLDASDLTTSANRKQIERHDVAECTLETLRPVACDEAIDIPQTGRFVIIDNYEIAGGGVILHAQESTDSLVEEQVRQREQGWDRSSITQGMRTGQYNQRSTLILICGAEGTNQAELAKALEENLFNSGRMVYYLGVSQSLLGLGVDIKAMGERDEYLRRLAEVAHLFTNAGLIFITTVSDLDEYELEMIEKINEPNDCLVVNIGENRFSQHRADLEIDSDADAERVIEEVKGLLARKNYFMEYYL